MPTLKTQYEEFCQAYVRSPNAGEAAREAGYAFEHRYQQGYRLLQRADICRRIAELRTAAADRDCVRVEALLTKLETFYRLALKDHNANAAVRVIELQAKLAGLIGGRGGPRPVALALDAAPLGAPTKDADSDADADEEAEADDGADTQGDAEDDNDDDAEGDNDDGANAAASAPAGPLPSPAISPSIGPAVVPPTDPDAGSSTGPSAEVRRAALVAVARSAARKRRRAAGR